MHACSHHRFSFRSFAAHLAVAGALITTGQNSAAWAGTEVLLTTTVQQAGENQTSNGVIKMQDGHLWMDMGIGADSERRSASIYRADEKHLTVVDHSSRSYSVMDQQAIGKIVDEMMSAMLQIDQQMGKLPAEQRKVLQDAWKSDRQRQSLKDNVVSTGQVATINGFSTRKYDVFKGEEKIREVWVANWNELPDSDSARSAMHGLEEFFLNMKSAFDSVSFASLGGARPFEMGDSPFQNMKEMNGFPIRTRVYRDGELISETEIGSAKKVDVPADAFAPPADYRRRTMDRE